MGTTIVVRKLTTILAADVAGYSRLMGLDEAGTIRALKAGRQVFDTQIAKHHGRIFGGAGDSIIAEFASAVEATEAAIAIQRELAGRRTVDNRDPDLRFRIGLNIGDVVVEGGDLFGEGINVAARIEAMAEPGGVCLSSAVYQQVRGKIALPFESIGRQTLKNIALPVEVYRIALDGKATPAHTRLLAAAQRHWHATAPISALSVLAAGLFAWLVAQRATTQRGSLSIAVLPLTTIGGDEATRRLADGLTEDIITDLSKFRGLDVVASNSASAYKDKKAGLIAKELGVTYVLEGKIQREADRLRITAQLIEATSGTHLWTQRWDRAAENAFAIQSEISEQVAATLASTESSSAMAANEIRKAKGRSPVSLEAYDHYLLAVEARGKFTKEAILAGIDAATKAIALDPSYAQAYATRSRLQFNTSHYGVDYDVAMQAMEADARKAVALAPDDPEARAALAWYYCTSGRNKEAENELRIALEVNPANITLIKMAAAVYSTSGHPEEGAGLADKVLRLDPLASSGTLNTIKDAYFFARRFADTVAVISRVPPDARSKGARLLLAASLALLGRKEEAERARNELLAAHPTISAELLANQGWKFERIEDEQLFLDAFRSANLPLSASEADLAIVVKPQRLPGCPTM